MGCGIAEVDSFPSLRGEEANIRLAGENETKVRRLYSKARSRYINCLLKIIYLLNYYRRCYYPDDADTTVNNFDYLWANNIASNVYINVRHAIQEGHLSFQKIHIHI